MIGNSSFIRFTQTARRNDSHFAKLQKNSETNYRAIFDINTAVLIVCEIGRIGVPI